MIFVPACDNCGSLDWRIYGVAVDEGTLHPVQCRCSTCGLIFANPRATADELDRFYQSFYLEGFPGELPPDVELADRVRGAAGHVRDVLGERRGKLLEIGFGSGVFLAAARTAGFDVCGVELSRTAVDYAQTNLGLHQTWCSSLEDRAFPSGEFDVVYAWHVIEHVADLNAFVGEIHRVLKPGGLLFIGTESGAHVATAFFRAWRRVRGVVPRPVTATAHTFVFSLHSLRDTLERRGFRIQRLFGYDEVRDRARTVRDGSLWKRVGYRLVWSVAQAGDRTFKTGPYLKCFAIKRD